MEADEKAADNMAKSSADTVAKKKAMNTGKGEPKKQRLNQLRRGKRTLPSIMLNINSESCVEYRRENDNELCRYYFQHSSNE